MPRKKSESPAGAGPPAATVTGAGRSLSTVAVVLAAGVTVAVGKFTLTAQLNHASLSTQSSSELPKTRIIATVVSLGWSGEANVVSLDRSGEAIDRENRFIILRLVRQYNLN